MNPGTLLYEPVPLSFPPLRVGVMLDGLEGEQWIRSILDQLAACPFVELAVAIVNRETIPRPARRGVQSRLKGQLYWQYSKFDAYQRPKSSCFARAGFSPPLSGVEVLSVVPRRKGFVHRFEAADVAALQARKLDVILRFGFNILRGDVLAVARCGLWSFHHDDNMEYRGGPPMFWEIYEGNPLTGTVLQILMDELDGGQIIFRTWGATANSMWLNQCREQLYRKSFAFVVRCLRRLYLLQNTTPMIEHDDRRYTKDRIFRKPTNTEMVYFFVRALRKSLSGRVTNQFTRVQWFLAYRRDPSRFIANTDRADMSGFVPMRPPANEFWADPSVITREGRDYVFFERYFYQTRRGEIAVFTFDDAGRPLPMQSVLRREYHLSNPFVFEWEGQIYMIPESADASAVQLFRAEEFPTRWRHERDLLTGLPMADATLHFHEGRWYMFVNVSETGGSLDDELFLFHADTPLGPWHPHAQNPIKSDVRSARPAGRLFRRGGALIRPSQDCSVAYGYAINFCEVETLSPTQYRERVVERIEPTWRPGLLGCHTLGASDTCEVVDAKWRIPRRPAWVGPVGRPASGF